MRKEHIVIGVVFQNRERIRKWYIGIWTVIAVLILFACRKLNVLGSSLEESPYVTFSPDNLAWTTNAGDVNCQWYPAGTQVQTGITSALRELEKGEHYYRYNRAGTVPVGSWQVTYMTGGCCHDNYPDGYYHGITYGTQCCFASYYSGWTAYCADCDEPVNLMYIYMSEEAAGTIKELDMNLHYYYLCPFCNNLEQGRGFEHHCSRISFNRYQVRYHANYGTGFMDKSIHYYNDVTEYEGETVTPQTHLNLNSYRRTGYEFVGWNTRKDGTGESFSDGQRIWNLTDENNGEVILYAQWKKSESTLQIDPAGGTYNGDSSIFSVKQEYGTEYVVDVNQIVPPTGAVVRFDVQGGTELAAVTVQQVFHSLTMSDPFAGKFIDNLYEFLGADGTVDRLTVEYGPGNLVLPKAEKTGYSFAGWFYDSECTEHAGVAGDVLTPTENIILYAKWVELILTAENNYDVYDGTGAVDLTWSQPDGEQKAYKIYQSRDNQEWLLISSPSDIGDEKQICQEFSYKGQPGTYAVPASGMYEITVNGAQGGDFQEFSGGKGGKVVAKVWLEQGEILTYTVGGQNGYNGGGEATTYGNGGGSTTVYSQRLGTFLVAGGGGGATAAGNGGVGGAASSLTTGSNGESGMAGGGGGYLGGKAGEYIVHTHNDSCYHVADAGYIVAQNGDGSWGYGSEVMNYSNMDYLIINGPDVDDGGDNWGWWKWGNALENSSKLSVTEMTTKCSIMGIAFGFQYKKTGGYHDSDQLQAWRASMSGEPIPVNGNTTLEIHAWIDNWDSVENGCIWVTDQNGNEIKVIDIQDFPEASAPVYTGDQSVKYVGDSEVYCINEIISLPEGTSGIRIDFMTKQTTEVWGGISIGKIQLTGGKIVTQICGMEEGEVIDSKPAYGGSNYAANVVSYTEYSGEQQGDGSVEIKSIQVGFMEELCLDAVIATDYAAPDVINLKTVQVEAKDKTTFLVGWQMPGDNGTPYFHQVESYLIGDVDALSKSNITKNTLTSGIKGYYYIVDTYDDTVVTLKDSTFLQNSEVEITLVDTTQYLHVAPVDVAGNLGEAVHIRLDTETDAIKWPVYTEQIKITADKNNIYRKADREYFVKADGVTPFMLAFSGYIDGNAREDYQMIRMIFDCEPNETIRNRMELIVPQTTITDEEITFTAQDVKKKFGGKLQLSDAGYVMLKKSNQGTKLHVMHKFTLDASYHGQQIYVCPIAGAGNDKIITYSDFAVDQTHGIYLIADGQVPNIEGTEVFDALGNLSSDEREDLVFVADDEGSGLRDFYAIVTNLDNAAEEIIYSQNGSLTLELTSNKAVFKGDFVVEFHAVDQVGNELVESYGSTQFKLVAELKRCLEPHTNVYRAGESGMLRLTTYGYAQSVKVEFPEEFIAINPGLNKEYLYEPPNFISTEEFIFMIPLDVPLGREYQIKVSAYKNSAILEEYLQFSVLQDGGTVLNEIRTRLR